MTKQELMSIARWLIFLAAVVCALLLAGRRGIIRPSGPVWKSFSSRTIAPPPPWRSGI